MSPASTERADEVAALLVEIRDLQKQALANQERSIAAQQRAIDAQDLAIARQQSHLRLYRVVVIIVLPLVAGLAYVLYRLAAPHL